MAFRSFVVAVLICLSPTAGWALDFTLSLGMEAATGLSWTNGVDTIDVHADAGPAVGIELEQLVLPSWSLGGGFDYLPARPLGNSPAEIESTVLFASSRWRLGGPSSRFNLVGRLGWAFNSIRDERGLRSGSEEAGGAYVGVGAGFRLSPDWSLEALWARSDSGLDSLDDWYGAARNDPQLDLQTVSLRARVTF